MTNAVDKAVEELARLSPKEALAVLAFSEERRKKDSFVRYWSPQPQQRPHFKLWKPEVKVFGILGGNRSGKTEEGAFITSAWALGKDYFRGEPAWDWVKDLPIPEPPNNIWAVGLDFQNVIKNVIWREKFLQGRNHPGFVPLGELEKPPSEADFQLYFKNGSVITCKSAESGREKFQSASVDLVWIDEEPEVEIYDECFQRTSDCGGKILLTLTPLTDVASGVRTPWVHDLWEDWKSGKSKDVVFVKLNVLDNPHIPEVEKQKLQEKWAGHPEEGARLYGDFVLRSGLIYNLWNPNVHMVKPFPIPRDWYSVVVIDPAPTGPSAALMGRVHPSGDLYVTREYKRANLVVSDHAANIKIKMAGEPVDIWGIDPQGGNQKNPETHKTIAQLYREHGLPVRLIDLPQDYGVAESREYLSATVTPGARHPKVYFFSDLYQIRDEIEHYVWATFARGEMRGLSKEKPLKRNDDLINCFQYMAAMKLNGRRAGKSLLTPEERVRNARFNNYTQGSSEDSSSVLGTDWPAEWN